MYTAFASGHGIWISSFLSHEVRAKSKKERGREKSKHNKQTNQKKKKKKKKTLELSIYFIEELKI